MQLTGGVEEVGVTQQAQAVHHVRIREAQDTVLMLPASSNTPQTEASSDPRVGMSVQLPHSPSDMDKGVAESPQPKGLLARRRKTVMAPPGSGMQGPESAYRSFTQSAALDHTASIAVGQRTAGRSMTLSATMAAARQVSMAPGQHATLEELNAAKAKTLASRRGLPVEQPVTPPALPSDGMPVWKRRILTGLNHRYYYVFLCLTTLYIVFEDDFKRACLPPSWDLPLETLIAVILVAIIIEMGLSSMVKSGYLLGFYFWVDCIVCTSLFFEVPAMKQGILGMGLEPIPLEQQDAFIKWAGNRAFISSKVARVARIFRLLRLLRIYSIYKRFEGRRRIRAALAKAGIRTGDGEQHIAEEELSMIELEILQDQNRETRVGQKLEDLIIRRIIVFVLVCVLMLPAFEAEYGLWGKWRGVDRGGLAMLHDMAVQDAAWTAPSLTNPTASLPSSFMTALMAFMSSVPFDLGRHQSAHVLELIIKNTTLLAYPGGVDRRYDELYSMRYSSQDLAAAGCSEPGMEGCAHWITYAVYDWKWFSQTAAILSISRSIFIIAFLTLGAWLLNRDSRSLVLEPIERMLARVSALADNPLALQPSSRAPWQEQIERMAAAQEQSSPQVGADSDVRSMMDRTARLSGLQRRKSNSQAMAAESQQAQTGQGMLSQPDAQRVQQGGSAPGATYQAWRLATTSVVAATRLKAGMAAMSSRWQRVRDGIKSVLRRIASNFWDGTDEDGAARPEQRGNGPDTASYETQLLENSIQKIGALLAVGFGDAGAEIIAENIRNEGDINPMVPGKKTVAVFGFCDIRQFTDTTEVLQEEVMEFVNSIARIVHTSVAIHGGAANKNIGDAFLLVWKMPKGFTVDDLREACEVGCQASQLTLGQPELPLQLTPAVMSPPIQPQPAAHVDDDNPSTRVSRATLGAAAIDPLSQDDRLAAFGHLALPPALMFSHEAIAEAVGEGTDGTEDAELAELMHKVHTLSKVPSIQEHQVQDVQEQIEALWPGLNRSSSASSRLSISKLLPLRPDSLVLPTLPMPSLKTSHPAEAAVALPSLAEHKPAVHSAGPVIQPSTSIKPRFMSIPDNRVVPLMSDGTGMAATRGKRVLSRNDTNDRSEVLPATSDNLESLALQRVMRMRSKVNSEPNKAVSAPEKAAVVAAVADNALASFIMVHAALKRSVRLAQYARRPDLIARLGANTRVAMGFGLHVGWAIEGAIGSEYKIDASYLSPNVNMASRLEAATKQFGVSVLMSENFADCLSGEMRAMVRQIDCVTVKGSTQPMGLFTFDINLDTVPDADPDVADAEEEEDAFWADYACGWCDGSQLTSIWGASPEFLAAFSQGFQAYRSGDWQDAQHLLTAASNMRTDIHGQPVSDPPSKVLLAYMEQFGFTAPPDWRGFRELTEK